MHTDAVAASGDFSPFEQLRYGREVIQVEAAALAGLGKRLDSTFCDAVRLLSQCAGSVIVTGMGKAGLIGQKIAATLASTGTSSHFLHPAEAVHGDLGRIRTQDVVLALSASGETSEVVRVLPAFTAQQNSLVSITGNARSTLARHSQVVLDLGPMAEACSLGLAPSTSTTAMLAMGDALALVVSRTRQFGREDFARFHPAGTLGRKLAKVEELMRPLAVCRLALETCTLREVLVTASKPGRRTGAIMLVNECGSLTGIFTDSDLARLLEQQQDCSLDVTAAEIMTRGPKTVSAGASLAEAIDLLAECKISELPVVDPRNRPLGMIDITDLVGIPLPAGQPAQPATGVAAANTLPFSLPSERRATNNR